MIWRSVICFSLLAVMAAAATVRGTVTIAREAKSKGGDEATVIWLTALTDNLPASRPLHAEIIQKGKTFQPHLLAIPIGSTVDFPNLDPIFHNAFSNYNGQIFDIGLYPPGSSRSVTFSREGVVRVFCNIHASMSALIVVLRSPYFTGTTKAGEFHLERVPEGKYRLHLYHERATEQTLKGLERDVDVTAGTTDLGAIAITESGYLSVPHLNKYGKPYSSSPDANTYPGSRP